MPSRAHAAAVGAAPIDRPCRDTDATRSKRHPVKSPRKRAGARESRSQGRLRGAAPRLGVSASGWTLLSNVDSHSTADFRQAPYAGRRGQGTFQGLISLDETPASASTFCGRSPIEACRCGCIFVVKARRARSGAIRAPRRQPPQLVRGRPPRARSEGVLDGRARHGSSA